MGRQIREPILIANDSLRGKGKAMDQYKIIFYAVLGTVVVIVSIVRFIGWRKEKRQEKENEK